MEITPYPDVELDTIFDSSLEDLELDDLIEICKTNQKYQEACTNQIFIENYEEKNFTITRNLVIDLLKNPAKFLQWIKNYSRWYLLTRNNDELPYFVAYSDNIISNTQMSYGVLGVFAIDESLDLVKKAMIRPEKEMPDFSMYNQNYRHGFVDSIIKRIDLDTFPSAFDILSILFEEDKHMGKDDYKYKTIAQLLVDIQLDGSDRSSLLYGLFSFIIRYGLYDSPQFILMYVVFYLYSYNTMISKRLLPIYFGDVTAISYGYQIEKPIRQKQQIPNELPNTFNEFKLMFMQMYAQYQIDQFQKVKYRFNKPHFIYMHQLYKEDLKLYGYLLLAEDGGNPVDIFTTTIFNTFIDAHYDLISDIYSKMIDENEDPITWLSNYRKQEEYDQTYGDLSFGEPNPLFMHKIERFSLVEFIRRMNLPNQFKLYCIIMLLLTGWYTIAL